MNLLASLLTFILLIGTLPITNYADEIDVMRPDTESDRQIISLEDESSFDLDEKSDLPELGEMEKSNTEKNGESNYPEVNNVDLEKPDSEESMIISSPKETKETEESNASSSSETEPESDQADIEETVISDEKNNETAKIFNTNVMGPDLYLNGSGGNDNNDGRSVEQAVKTFAKVKELAAADQNVTTIYIAGTVPISGEISLAGTKAILKREPSFNDYLLRIESGTEATLTQITIDGNTDQASAAERSLIKCNGTLNIQDNTILQNNQIGSSNARRSGGAIYVDGGRVNMTGGLIQNNSATFGGGLFATRGATFNMSAGTIKNNQAVTGPSMENWNDAAAGGGVCLLEGGTFNLSGGLIQGNFSEETGGGISVGAIEASTRHSNYLNMTGGQVDGNASGSTGGGIFVQAAYVGSNSGLESVAKITAGQITNNQMTGSGVTNKMFGGGGIYVNGYRYEGFKNGQLFLENVIICNNKAKLQGGGYAACPISETKIYLKNGAAIYANESQMGSSPDIYLYSLIAGMGAHGGNPEYYISNTMLGGVPYHWKYDDNTFVPLNSLSGKLVGEDVFLGLHTDERGNNNTENQAKVLISGNTSATRGGGIGSNGNVTIGSRETTEISVHKIWQDEDNQAGIRPKSIEIELFRKIVGSEEEPVYIGYESMEPDKNGDWFLTFTDLAKDDGAGHNYEYSIKERPVKGYATTVSGNMSDGFTLTNSLGTEVRVEKVWQDDNNQDGLRPDYVTVKLLADGQDTGKTQILSEDNNWKSSFTNLAMYKNGVEIVYTVEEVNIDHVYTCKITGDSKTGFVITNTKISEKTEVSGKKTWNDNENNEGKRPDSITIRLYKNGIEIDSRIVTEADNWMWKFENLAKYENGQAITYTIAEDAVEGYTSEICGYDVINNYKPEKTIIRVIKSWQDNNNQSGQRPDRIMIKLLANGVDTGKRLSLSVDNRWMDKFIDLATSKDGKKILYTIQEMNVDKNYTSTITGDAFTGFKVINTLKPNTPPTMPDEPKTPGIVKTGENRSGIWIGLALLTGASVLILIRRKRKSEHENE